MIEQIFDKLDPNSQLVVRAALAQPALREFFQLAATEYDKGMLIINPDQPAEQLADQYRSAKTRSAAFHNLVQFIQQLITQQTKT